jgi:hypothetical protein
MYEARQASLIGGGWTRRWSGTCCSRFAVFPPCEGMKWNGGGQEGGSHDSRFQLDMLCLFISSTNVTAVYVLARCRSTDTWIDVVLPRASSADFCTIF